MTALFEDIIYDITVTNGMSSVPTAKYQEEVTVKANAPATGKEFDKWVVTGITLSDEDLAKSTLTFKMPAINVTMEATYKDVVYRITVTNGSIVQQKIINPTKKQKNLARKRNDAMFLPSAKAMCLRRDVCLRHVADSIRVRPPPYTKTTAVAVVIWCTRGESEGAKRRNSEESEFTRGTKRQPEGSTAKQCAFMLKRTDSPPYTKTTAGAVVIWCTRGESNPRHPASEAGALSN